MSITYDGTIYEEISVDVSQQNEFAPRLVKQGDAYTRGYIITLTENGEPLTIPTENTTALFNCRNKTDKTKRASATGTININGTVTVKVPTVVMEVAGFIQCDISIITASGNDTNILKSTLFYLNCEEAANPNGTTTAAEDSILAGIAAGNIVPPAGPYVPKTRQIAGIDLQDDIATAELKTALSVPTKTSDLNNDSSFMSQEQTNTAIANAISGITTVKFRVVSALPPIQGAQSNIIYLVPNEDGDDNLYDEWIVINYAWEPLGSTRVDISGKEDSANKVIAISASPTNTQYPSALAVKNYVDTVLGNVETLLSQV